jgi:hypothetical protein
MVPLLVFGKAYHGDERVEVWRERLDALMEVDVRHVEVDDWPWLCPADIQRDCLSAAVAADHEEPRKKLPVRALSLNLDYFFGGIEAEIERVHRQRALSPVAERQQFQVSSRQPRGRDAPEVGQVGSLRRHGPGAIHGLAGSCPVAVRRTGYQHWAPAQTQYRPRSPVRQEAQSRLNEQDRRRA